MPENTKKVVYLIGPRGGPVKIGITDNIASRRSTLNVGNPQYLYVLLQHEFASQDEAIRAETELHWRFRGKHIRGEWFQLSESDVDSIATSIHAVLFFGDGVPAGWSLSRKACDEFTAAVCIKARGALGLTREQLARLAGLSTQTVVSFEDGERAPQPETIEAIRSAMQSKGVEFVQQGIGKPLKILV